MPVGWQRGCAWAAVVVLVAGRVGRDRPWSCSCAMLGRAPPAAVARLATASSPRSRRSRPPRRAARIARRRRAAARPGRRPRAPPGRGSRACATGSPTARARRHGAGVPRRARRGRPPSASCRGPASGRARRPSATAVTIETRTTIGERSAARKIDGRSAAPIPPGADATVGDVAAGLGSPTTGTGGTTGATAASVGDGLVTATGSLPGTGLASPMSRGGSAGPPGETSIETCLSASAAVSTFVG